MYTLRVLKEGRGGRAEMKRTGASADGRQDIHSILRKRIFDLESEVALLKRQNDDLQRTGTVSSLILETVSEIFTYQDTDHRFLWVNRATADSLGRRPDELVGRRCYEIRHQLKEHCKGCPISRAARTGKIEEGEITTKEGRVWFVQGYPVKDDRRKIVGFIEFCRDVTKQKQAREKSGKEHEKYRRMIETANEGVWEMDDRFRTTFANRRMAEILGYEPEEMIGRPFEWFLFEEDLEDHAAKKADRQLGKRAFYERKFRRKDGSTVWTTASATAIRNERGEFSGAFAMFTDITKRKEMEATLRESERRYRLLADNARDVIFVMDTNLNYTYISPSVRNLRGYEPEEVLKTSWTDALTPASLEVVRNTLARALEWDKAEGRDPSRSKTVELEVKVKDGSTIWTETKLSFLRDESSLPIGIMGVIRNITSRVRKDEILRARLRLSEFAADHTLDELLRKAVDEAEMLTGSGIGFIDFVERDQRTISLQMWSTNTLEKMCKAKFKRRHYNIDQAGMWADCIRERRPLIHNDLHAVPGRNGLPAGHVPVVRELVAPVVRCNHIVAVLGVGNKPRDYDSRDVEIVSLLADLAWDIAESKRAEEALRESEQKYHELFDKIRDGVMIVDPQTTQIVEANTATTNMYGYEPHGMAGLKATDISNEPEATFEAMTRTEPFIPLRYHKRKNGSAFPVEISNGSFTHKGKTFVISSIRDISERKRVEEALRASLDEKEILLREIHHRVKNNLAAIVGLVGLQRSAPGDTLPVHLTDLEARIRSMALVHEMLYESDDLSRIDLQRYFLELTEYLQTTYDPRGRISIGVNAERLGMNIDTAIPCGLVVNEIVTNALKYAFPNGDRRPGPDDSRVSVSMSAQDSTFTLSIADNGVGLPPSLDWTTTKTLGLRLVRMLGQHQLGGRMAMDVEAGTRFSLTFVSRKRKDGHG